MNQIFINLKPRIILIKEKKAEAVLKHLQVIEDSMHTQNQQSRMEKTFKVSQVRELLDQVFNEKITFSRFVEILNEQVENYNK